ncbi:MAG: hypothetical protein KC561_09335, partial [Myxococcales bacterium]|nr:hypothetical protein [Myxococcales bacterium]
GSLVVEPWLDRVVDVSVQFEVGKSGEQPDPDRVLGITRFRTNARGQYKGTHIGPFMSGLEPELRRWIAGPQGKAFLLSRHLERTARFVATKLRNLGYSGPAGVDAMVYRDARGLRLKPIVEINPRYTMGHIALALEGRVPGRRSGEFQLVSGPEAKRLGFATLPDYYQHLVDADAGGPLSADCPERRIALSEPRAGAIIMAVLHLPSP